MSVLVVLPALDEEATVGDVVASLPAEVDGVPVRALVVDDGSTDATAEIARRAGATVVSHPRRRGGGAALRTGFAAAPPGTQVIVTMDADGQHLASDLPALVRPVLAGRADVVVGSRRLGSGDGPRRRAAGVVLYSALTSVVVGQPITDVSSGYRALRADILPDLRLEQESHHTAELLIEACRRGHRVVEVPVTIRVRQAGHTKKGRTVVYGLRFGRTVLATWLRA